MSDDRPQRRHPNVVHLDELEPRNTEKGTRFGAAIKGLGRATGGTLTGCNWFEVQPGRAAFPLHYHCATEEAIFVLQGRGTLRLGGETIPVAAGDYAAFPVGPEHAHQLVNDGEEPLRYLCLSNKVTTDVVGYPDSGKVGATGSPNTDFFSPPWVRSIFRADSAVDYYEGEETGEQDPGAG